MKNFSFLPIFIFTIIKEKAIFLILNYSTSKSFTILQFNSSLYILNILDIDF